MSLNKNMGSLGEKYYKYNNISMFKERKSNYDHHLNRLDSI